MGKKGWGTDNKSGEIGAASARPAMVGTGVYAVAQQGVNAAVRGLGHIV
jgi:hypothetical protein